MATDVLQKVPLAHLQIADLLRARLGTQWRTGDRLPPIGQLAHVLGAGQCNTHRAVQELAKQGLLVSRPRHGTFVSDRFDNEQLRGMNENRGASSSVSSAGPLQGRVIGMLAPELGRDQHHDDMIRSVEMSLVVQGAQVRALTRPLADTKVIERQNDLRLLTESVDALVVVKPPERSPLQLHTHQMLVVISPYGQMEVKGTEHYDIVTSDEVQGSRLAAQHLRACGVKRPCFIGARDAMGVDRFDKPSTARCRAFADAWGEPLPESHQLQTPRYGEDSGACALREFRHLNPLPDGIFCAADELAVGVVMGALALGLEAGRDYHLIGFDGQERGQTFAAGPLTTIRVPAAEMGHRAGELLTQRLLGRTPPPQRIYLGCKLLLGSTSQLQEIAS